MELSDYRGEIDRIDSQIVRLLTERMDVCRRIAEWKNQKGLPVLDEAREQEKLERLAAAAPEEYADDVQTVYRLLFALSRRQQIHHMEKEAQK